MGYILTLDEGTDTTVLQLQKDDGLQHLHTLMAFPACAIGLGVHAHFVWMNLGNENVIHVEYQSCMFCFFGTSLQHATQGSGQDRLQSWPRPGQANGGR